MPTITEALTQAFEHHQAGDLAQAEQLYQHVLQLHPDHPDALYLLGLLAHQRGQHPQALACLRRAARLQPGAAAIHFQLAQVHQALGQLDEVIACYQEVLRLQPTYTEAHNNLGLALQARGRRDEAIASYCKALALRADFPEIHNNLGNALVEQGRLEEAVACYQEALRLRPNLAEAHNNLGNALRKLGQLDEAIVCFNQALHLQPYYADAHNDLGSALQQLQRLDEAVLCFRHAVSLRPGYAEAHFHLGAALQEQERLEEAMACYRQALLLRSAYPEAHSNLGNILQDQGRLLEAMACYRHALALRADSPEVHNNLGNALKEQGRLDEASACFEEVLRLRPDYPEARWNRSLVWLVQGRFEEGWPEYEWRLRRSGYPARLFSQPRWDGSALDGRAILVYAEQGLGDTVQFVRYLPLVKERGGTVVLECQPALRSWLTCCRGLDQLVARGDPLPGFDVQTPLLSLPGILQTTRASIPARVPYLEAEPLRVGRWKQELPAAAFKVGIVWQGSLCYKTKDRRSVPLARFAPLADVAGARLYSLQKGPGAEQLAGADFPVTDLATRLHDFADTAAVLKNLDLVVTVDTAVAHCAGALAMPVWVALPFAPDWRWLLEREDSPWYPTMRLFRQQHLGAWREVFERMGRELRNQLALGGVFARS